MDNELFEKAPIPRAYMTLAIPVVLSMMVTLVYNTVDTYFIAHTGNTDMVAGVSIATPVFTVMIALGDIFGLGGSSVISRLYGKGRFDDGRRLSVFCFWGAVFTGIIVIILGLTFHDPILTMLGADDSTWRYASQFYSLIILGSPFIIVSMTPSNLLRTEGFAGPSAVGSIAGTAINICLNPLFIHVFGWGAAGSAGATVIANICTDLYFVWFLLKRSRNLSIDPRLMFRSGHLDISRQEASGIFAIGIPASVTNLMQSLGIVMVNLFLLPYGNDAVAAMGIALKIVMIAVMILVAFAFGGQPLIGYNYGAGNMSRLKALLKFAYSFLGMLALVMTAVLIACGSPVDGILQHRHRHRRSRHRHATCAAAEHRMRVGGARDHLHVPIRRQGPGRTATVRQPSGRDARHHLVRRQRTRRISRGHCRAGLRRPAHCGPCRRIGCDSSA